MNNHNQFNDHIDSYKWLNPCRNPEVIKAEFDEIAKNYDSDMQEKGYSAPEEVARILAKLIPVTDHILDAGCGTGLVGLALQRQGFNHITGLDFSTECLKEAGKKNIYRDLVNRSLLERLPFEDNTFDVVICIGVLLRFNKTELAFIIDEFSRVCLTNGLIFFTYRSDFMQKSKLLDDLKHHAQLVIEQVSEPCPIFTVDENMKDLYGHYIYLRNRK